MLTSLVHEHSSTRIIVEKKNFTRVILVEDGGGRKGDDEPLSFKVCMSIYLVRTGTARELVAYALYHG